MESYRLGVNSYIVKPVDFEKFLETVSKVGFYWSLMNKIPPQHSRFCLECSPLPAPPGI